MTTNELRAAARQLAHLHHRFAPLFGRKEAQAQLLIYLAAAVSIAFGFREVLYFWFLPALLAQPLLRALLIAEHTGCSQDRNGLTNTRTTLATFPIRLLMWNMPYHAEHHLYPAIPFYLLPALHREVRTAVRHVASGYVAANREIVQSL